MSKIAITYVQNDIEIENWESRKKRASVKFHKHK